MSKEIRKIAVRGGHNFQATGARGIIDETTEDRKVKDAVIKYLRQAGYEVLDVTPGNCDVNTDLAYGVNKAENWGTDLFLSIHFDKAYDKYEGALGHACWVYRSGSESADIAQNIVNNVCNEIGFKNRGVRVNSSLYELRKTTMPAIIIETCFCEATEDVRIYKEKGADAIGKAIAEGVSKKQLDSSDKVEETSPVKPSKPSPESKPQGKNIWEVSIQGEEVKRLQHQLNVQGYGDIKEDGYFGESTLSVCPTVREGARGNITKCIQQRLLNRGYTSLKSNGGADGVFGRGTTIAIKNLQRNKGLNVDGIVGKNTWKALYRK
ncbi:N-acetylmuramoyl-L-alanine amidase [Clostridium chrysemydis]|uniref:N-acetylmuramoyl-L-alanine amidase n=1 Tax=Clostridium chrysemydis TaxID=2665504 RepID=UPI0018837FF2|nr:N-acetylmuramoyl-L-alanine amidase [Clostridium chrysemydis]